MRSLELLSPAADRFTAEQAILHGADAVYMGGPSHGARKKASNSIDDIRETVKFAHRFNARVYVAVNTIVFENELRDVERLCRELYTAGVDALIVQDMALLRLDLPPIALHASTQCDIRTVEKARFLEDVGFSQIVLARELSLKEINDITSAVSIPVECFVHGALCVSYSGRCGASQISLGRSGNRGECAQMCRMPYTLRNGRGEVLDADKYLLSLRDFNLSDRMEDLVKAGVSSFKIEGRLKDSAYVRNVTASYTRRLDELVDRHRDLYRRASCGRTEVRFTPVLEKSFNRGFTSYFIDPPRNGSRMASLDTPKSMGEVIRDVSQLHNGDGISFFNSHHEYEGININRVDGNHIIFSRPFRLPPGTVIHRTFDREWNNMMAGETASRRIKIHIAIDEYGITASDERGNHVRIPLEVDKLIADNPMDPKSFFDRLGNTIYKLERFDNLLSPTTFIPASRLTALRRRLIEQLDRANETNYRYDYRRPEKLEAIYPSDKLDPRDNVANSIAEAFYRSHGVTYISPALEVAPQSGGLEVMTTRYCLRRELGCCLCDSKVSEAIRKKYAPPLTISTGPHVFNLEFDCVNCEMRVVSR